MDKWRGMSFDRRNDDLYVLGSARVERCALVSDVSDVLVQDAVAWINLLIFLVLRYVATVVVCYALYVLFLVYKCDVFVCFDVGAVFAVV